MSIVKKLVVILFLLSSKVLSAQYDKDKKKDYLVTVSTDFGDMFVLLYDETPLHKKNFIKLAQEEFFNGTTFHRIIQGFMIQGGDPNSKDDNPNNDGQGGPSYTIPAEFKKELFHKKGALSAARMGDRVNPKKESSGSQFYVVQGKKYSSLELTRFEQGYGMSFSESKKQLYTSIGGTPHLDNNYTVFGEVIKGLNVIDEIAKQPKNNRDRPNKNIEMKISVSEMKKKKITKLTGFIYL